MKYRDPSFSVDPPSFAATQGKSVAWLNIYQSGEYLERNPSWHIEESPWKAEQVLRMLKQNGLLPGTICEVGCGAGEVLKQLREKIGHECTFWGYEISPQAFELCKLKENKTLHFKMLDIQLERNTYFDLILVLDVLEHLEDCFSFLRTIRPKSPYKMFHIPLDLSAQTVLRQNALLKRRNMYGHIHYFTKETALRLLEDAGYQVLDYFYTPRSIEFASEPIQKVLKPMRTLFFAIHQDWTARVLGGFSLLVLAR